MRKLVLAAVLVLMASGAQAASYQLTNGNVVDPIQNTGVFGAGNHHYSGPNLEPGVVAPGADLHAAILNYADLTNANLSGADLGNSSMIGANLTGANLSSMPTPTGHTNLLSLVLTNANLTNANLTGTNWTSIGDTDGANFSGANLSGATWCCGGTPNYDALTNFTGALTAGPGSALFDPVAAGWNLVPEPNTALLVGIGLAGMAARRRPGR